MQKTVLTLIMVLTACGWASSEELSSAEITSIFEQLCQTPVTGWVQSGCVEAVHESFDAMTGETTETHESVTTDGERFAWNIQTVSITKNKKKKAEETDEAGNRERLFVWDGQSYTLYFKSGRQAITYESPQMPVRVNGPLTAGIIPWGHGVFTLENLIMAQVSATRMLTNEGPRIEMVIQIEKSPEMRMTLDPERNYAVCSYTLMRPESLRTVHTYGNFALEAERWTPMNILIEQFDDSRLSSSDSWEIVTLKNQTVELGVFTPSFEEKTRVEYHTPALEKPAFYRHSNRVNTKSLLDKRVEAGLKKGLGKQNCGTVAVGYIFEKLGVEATDQELASLVNDTSNDTSLYQIQQLVQQKGVSCAAVKTKISALSELKDCQILLHFPKKKHFLVLDRIEGDSVWLIDLDRQTFYHTLTRDEFEQEWAGIALIVSSQAPALGRDYIPVPEDVLKKIKGAADYSCSELIQAYDVILCPEMVLGTCGGRYYMYYDRFGCKLDPDGGFCAGSDFVGHVYSPCIEDWYYPGTCNVLGEWRVRYMRACEP
ncbi:MAG: cysteine peptidase family C39 domain-containing protein [Phycisphaerae bacterium]|nr:cysteine peptidase family C39 domain-containing protein [Phycisphaerae bacterium]